MAMPMRTDNGGKAGFDWRAFLRDTVCPRLQAEDVFTHPAHNWQKSPGKWRGGCPWHESQSGTAFYLDLPELLWRCPQCEVGGGALEYLWKLHYGAQAPPPRGRDFLDVLRRLCELAGVPFPEREGSAEAAERLRRLKAREAVLQDVFAHCRQVLHSEAGAAALAYLRRRGLDTPACLQLHLGLYPAAADLRRHLRGRGHADDDVRCSAAVSAGMEGYVVFPWRDESGRSLTAYGRWPGEPPEGKPKTRALPNPRGAGGAEIEHTKRSPLYLDRALAAGVAEVVTVEGVLDAAVLQANGDPRVVACVAAHLSEDQVETLRRRRVRRAVLCLDPDQAGDAAARSNVVRLRAAGVTPYVAPRLPDGQDPDEFVLANGVEVWREHVAAAVHGYRHVARMILAGGGPREAGDDGWSDRVVEAALEFSADLPAEHDDELTRHFWPEIAAAAGADVGDLRTRLREARTARRATGPGPGSDESALLATTPLSSLRPKPVRWLVPRYVPLGKVVLVAGDGGHGKSTLALHLAACLSRGAPAFGLDDPQPPAGDTLLIQCEDDWEDTVLPRLLALGADLGRIHRQDGVRGADGKLAPFCLAHYQTLERTLTERPEIKLVVIDPAGAYIGPGVDDHKDSELRALLGPLAELAARRRVTILLVKHFSKAPTAKAVSKISGSTGYVNSVRAAFVVLPDQGDEDRALFLPVKFNIGRRPKGRAFRRVSLAADAVDAILQPFEELSSDDRRRIGEAVFTLNWEGEVDVTADAHLAETMRAERGPKKAERCADWLKAFLQEHAYPSDEILAAAREHGFTFDNVKEAKAALKAAGLRSTNRGSYQGTWWCGFGHPDQWRRRPEKGAPHSPHSPHNGATPGDNHRAPANVGSVGSVGSADPETIKGPWVAPDADPSCLETPFD
jgi:hypothetical protein